MREKTKQLLIVLLIIIVTVLSVSCPASPPTIEDSNSSLYQKPPTPQNVKATNGYDGLIRISWDPVEDVDGYIILGSKSSEFDNGLTQFDIVTGADTALYTLEAGNRNVDVNQSYIFSVVSYKIYNKTERVLSDNSTYVEGSFAPSELSFHAIINDYYIYLYWMSPTLYKQYYTGGSELLYDADFVVSYGKSSEPVAEWTDLDETDNNSGVTPWLSQRIETNWLDQEEEYSFHVTMNIKNEEGTQISSLTSSDVSFEILSEMGTSPIKPLEASTDRIDGIELTWKIPHWTNGATRDNSYFTIQRTKSGSSNWETLVDETQGLVHSNLIEMEGEELHYLDTNVVAGDKYIYRIRNTATDDKNNQYTHVDSLFEPSNPGSLFELNVISKEGTWTPDTSNFNAADVSISWSWDNTLPEGLRWNLVKVETDVEGDKLESNVDIRSANIVDNKLTITFKESLKDDLSFRKYSYYLNLYNGDKLFGEYGDIQFTSDSQLTLGNTLTAASGDDLNTIILQWLPDAVIDGQSYSYGYREPNGSWTKVPFDINSQYIEFIRPEGSGNEFEFQLYIGDTAVSNILVRNFIIPAVNVKASKGTVEDEITVSWDVVDGADGYEIFYSASGNDNSYSSTGIEKYGNRNSSTFIHDAGYFNIKAYVYDINGNKIYTELGSIAEGETETAFGDKKAANYGYAFNSEPEIVLSTDDGTYFRDNLVFYINPDISHYSYDIAIGDTHLAFTTSEVMDGKTHTIENGSVKYANNRFEVSTSNFIGTLNENLTLNESVSVTVNNSNKSLSADTSYRNIRRGLSEHEVIEQTNEIFRDILKIADSEFESDWWISLLNFNESYTVGEIATVYRKKGPIGSADEGKLYLNNYVPQNSTAVGKVTITNFVTIGIGNSSVAGPGGNGALSSLDSNAQNDVTLILPSSNNIDYRTYKLTYNDVSFYGTSGNYLVTGSPNFSSSQIEASEVGKLAWW